jgi:hypothetical protein
VRINEYPVHSYVDNISSPVFDPEKDTFDALHERSPFAVNSICMVAARVRDGGGMHYTNTDMKLMQ